VTRKTSPRVYLWTDKAEGIKDMTGVEVDLVARDSREALALYEWIFEVEKLEATSLDRGLNKAVFALYGARIHLLDENREYGLNVPESGAASPMWLNVMVEDIGDTFRKALEAGCKEIQPVTRM
jgi:PhnB protein